MISSHAYRPVYLAIQPILWLAVISSSALAQERENGNNRIRQPREGMVEFEEPALELAAPGAKPAAPAFNVLAIGQGDPDRALTQLEARLKLRVEQIDRDCKLTPLQRNKLNVAGRGDIKHAFAHIEELKARYRDFPRGFADAAQLANDLAVYRASLSQRDCFGEGSLFAKILEKTLTPQQVALREKAVLDALNAQHRSTIRWAVGTLGIWLQLHPAQHEKLENLLITRTRAPEEVWRVRLLRLDVSGLEAAGERAEAGFQR